MKRRLVAATAGLGILLLPACGAPGWIPGRGTATPAIPTPVLPDGAKPVARFDGEVPAPGEDGPPAIFAAVETERFPEATGDVADDPAVWRNSEHPEQSLVLGANKSDEGGVGIYDLSGRMLEYVKGSRIGNIDLRAGTPLGGPSRILVSANDRDDGTLRLWSLDPSAPAKPKLIPLKAGVVTTMERTYGSCLGRTPDGSHTYAVVTQESGGQVEQYELTSAGGRIEATKVRTLDLGSQVEGCAVDDTTGALYVSQENTGLWRYRLDPATGDERTSVDTVEDGHLEADVEGVAAVRDADGRGVVIVSSQGDSTYAVYDADHDNRYLGSFKIRREGAVDGATLTDGVAAFPGSFGPTFPNGLLVVHDGSNKAEEEGQEEPSNFKLVRLDRVITLSPR